VRMLTVSEMDRLVWGNADGRRVMMVLRAAFDLSSAYGVTAVGGYVGDIEAWEAVEPGWKDLLAGTGLQKFRLFEIKRKFRDDWVQVVKPFAQLIRDTGLRCISAVLKDSDWKLMPHDAEYLKICPRKQHACLDMLFSAIAEDVRLEFRDEPLTAVFDCDYGTNETALAVYNAWRNRSGHHGFNLFFKGDVSWDAVPLECADLVAGLLRIDPLCLAMLNNDFTKFRDDNPLSHLSSLALGGRGVMWSAKTAKLVEEAERRRKS